MEVKVKIEGLVPQQVSKRLLGRKAQIFTAETIQRYMNQFVPMRTGALSQTFTIKQSEPYGIEYTQPYAHRMYYGDGFNFRKEFHPKAQSRWADPVNANYKPVIAKEVTQAIRSGRFT